MSKDGTWAFENVSFMIWVHWWRRHINKTTSKFHCESGKDSKLLLNNNSTFKMGCSSRQNKGLLHLVNKKVLNGDYLNPCSFGEQYTIKKSWRNNTNHKNTSMNHSLCSQREANLVEKNLTCSNRNRRPKEPMWFGFYSHMKTPLNSALYCTSNCRPTTLSLAVSRLDIHVCCWNLARQVPSPRQQGCESRCLVTDLWHTA